MQDDTEKRTIDLKPAVVVNKTKLPEFIHKKLTRARVVPIISASIP